MLSIKKMIEKKTVINNAYALNRTHRRQARRQLNWIGGGMDSQYKLLSELLSDQAAFITSPKTRLANYWGALPPLPPPSVYGPDRRYAPYNLILPSKLFAVDF